MEVNKKFGECLRSLLLMFDISIVRLSKVLNLDSSLVNRWVNEKRVPSYNSNYIERISEYLSHYVLNSYQEQHLGKLFAEVCGDSRIEISVKEKIKRILLQSQGYSIEYQKKEKQQNADNLTHKKKATRSLDSAADYVKIIDTSNFDQSSLQAAHFEVPINLSSKDKILIGYENILAAGISLLEASSNYKGSNNTIYISFNSNTYISNSEIIRYKNSLLSAINHGWNILFLIRLDHEINRMLRFINFIQPLIYTGKFQPYYFKKYDLYTTYDEYIIVPEIGTLMGFSSHQNSQIQSAFYFQNKYAINIIKSRFDTLVFNHAKSLVKNYKLNNTLEYADDLTENEEYIGNRILYKQDLGILMLTEDLYIKLLKREHLNSEEVSVSLKYYKRRQKAFLSNISRYSYIDIYHNDCINKLIKYKKLRLYMYNMTKEIDLESDDIIDLLKNIIALLKSYRNYSIAFTTQNFHITMPNFTIYCVVKERSAVMIESYLYSSNTPEARLSTKEPLLVKAFEVYFTEMIDQIAPINKDKQEIIKWIESFVV